MRSLTARKSTNPGLKNLIKNKSNKAVGKRKVKEETESSDEEYEEQEVLRNAALTQLNSGNKTKENNDEDKEMPKAKKQKTVAAKKSTTTGAKTRADMGEDEGGYIQKLRPKTKALLLAAEQKKVLPIKKTKNQQKKFKK